MNSLPAVPSELQNHPTERVLPVPSSLRYIRHQPGQPPFLGYMALALIPLLIAVSVILLGVEGGVLDATGRTDGNVIAGIQLMASRGGGFILAWTLIPLILAILLIPGLIKGVKGPRVEQLRYYKLRAAATGEQDPYRHRDVLRVGAAISHEQAIWPYTLEPWPLQRFGPDRPANELAATERFVTMDLVDTQHVVDQLSADWGIEDHEAFVSAVSTGLEYGEQSLSLALLVDQGDAKTLTQLAEQLEVEAPVVADLVAEDRLPQLLWAYDLSRLHLLIRYGFAAQYLDEAQTRRFLAIITSYIGAIFPDESQFLANYRLGAAYVQADSGKKASEKIANLHQKFSQEWLPQLDPWPYGEAIDLPETLRTGFAAQREASAEQRASQTVDPYADTSVETDENTENVHPENVDPEKNNLEQ